MKACVKNSWIFIFYLTENNLSVKYKNYSLMLVGVSNKMRILILSLIITLLTLILIIAKK